MKKFVLISCLLFFCISANAQDPDPDLFNQTWYLYQVYDSDFNDYFYVEGYQPYGGNPPIPQIMPFVFIEETLNFTAMGICNQFDGTLEKDVSSNSFRTSSVGQTIYSCGFYEDMDEPYLVGPFGYVDPDPTFFTILNPQITDDSDGFQTMTFGSQPFLSYTYRNTPILSNTDFLLSTVDIYPNPVQDILFIDSQVLEDIRLTIYANTGKQIMIWNLNTGSTSVDVSSIESGLYFVEIGTSAGTRIQKIIKD